MQQKSELPEGWELVSFGDILEINPSKPPKDIVSPDTPVTFVPMPAVDAVSGEITDPEVRPFSEVRKGYTAFQNDDVILAKITPCMENGKAAVVRNLLNNLGFGSTEFIVFRSKGTILPEYFHHYIRQESYRKLAESNMTGSVGQKRVPKDFVQNSIIPLPPLPEQHRIVSAIESLFARMDATTEKLDRVPGILKKFRESVLAAACEGRLTEDWREENPDIENSSLLLKKIKSFRKHVLNSKKQVEEEYDDNQNNVTNGRYANIPDTWSICQIKDISIVNLGGTPSRKIKSYWNGNINWLSSGEIANCRIISTKEKITEEGLRDSNAKLYPPKTVLIAMIGEGKTRGQSAILEIYSCTNQNVAALLFDTDHVSPEYVFRWALGEYERNRSVGRGGSQPALNGQKVRELIIPLPPLSEQQEIVRRVDALFAFADSIEAKVAAARDNTEKLRQSILAKAFSGELVETEAEIARREGRNYETAEVLIERIKEERGKVERKDK